MTDTNDDRVVCLQCAAANCFIPACLILYVDTERIPLCYLHGYAALVELQLTVFEVVDAPMYDALVAALIEDGFIPQIAEIGRVDA